MFWNLEVFWILVTELTMFFPENSWILVFAPRVPTLLVKVFALARLYLLDQWSSRLLKKMQLYFKMTCICEEACTWQYTYVESPEDSIESLGARATDGCEHCTDVGNQTWSSAIAAPALNHWAISPVPMALLEIYWFKGFTKLYSCISLNVYSTRLLIL